MGRRKFSAPNRTLLSDAAKRRAQRWAGLARGARSAMSPAPSRARPPSTASASQTISAAGSRWSARSPCACRRTSAVSAASQTEGSGARRGSALARPGATAGLRRRRTSLNRFCISVIPSKPRDTVICAAAIAVSGFAHTAVARAGGVLGGAPCMCDIAAPQSTRGRAIRVAGPTHTRRVSCVLETAMAG